MTDGTRIYIELLGQESVALFELNKACDKVLLHDWEEYGIQEPELCPTGLPLPGPKVVP